LATKEIGMKNGDLREACLALLRSRFGAGRATQPAAVGWKLANSAVSADELAAVCAAWLAGTGSSARGTVAQPCWRPSPLLRAFFAEYHKVRSGPPTNHAERGSTSAPRPNHGSDRRADYTGSH
jgi:hypothetical protein